MTREDWKSEDQLKSEAFNDYCRKKEHEARSPSGAMNEESISHIAMFMSESRINETLSNLEFREFYERRRAIYYNSR